MSSILLAFILYIVLHVLGHHVILAVFILFYIYIKFC